MAGITIGGLGSGLDTRAIIDALVRVESLPIDALEAKKTTEKKKLSLLSTLEGYVNTLRTNWSYGIFSRRALRIQAWNRNV